MNRREFLQMSGLVGCFTLLFGKFEWLMASQVKSTETPSCGLPAGLPFCLTPSPNLRKPVRHYTYLPTVSRPTSHGGRVVRVPRRRLLKFWEKYD